MLSYGFTKPSGDKNMAGPTLSPRAKQMHALIKKYHSSGVTQKQFYEEEELVRSTFLYWLYHYRRHVDRAGKPARPTFIPLSVKESPAPIVPANCSVSFPGGVTVRFDGQADAGLLIELIKSGGA
jgi:hypothetical protein